VPMRPREYENRRPGSGQRFWDRRMSGAQVTGVLIPMGVPSVPKAAPGVASGTVPLNALS